jgi:hypothetical protein
MENKMEDRAERVIADALAGILRKRAVPRGTMVHRSNFESGADPAHAPPIEKNGANNAGIGREADASGSRENNRSCLPLDC